MGIKELILITAIVEILEVLLQYGSTLKESLNKIYSYYKKSPFLFFATNIGYIWLLFIAISYNKLNFALILGIMLKTFDIFTKISLIDKLYIRPNNQYIKEVSLFLNNKVPLWVYLIGVFTYPYIIYVAFN